VNFRENLDWSYIKERASSLKIDLRPFLLRSLERIPVSVDNMPKVRKELRALIEEKLPL